MKVRLRWLLPLVLVVALAGCSTRGDAKPRTESGSPTAPAASLREVCPQVEQALGEIPTDQQYEKVSYALLSVTLNQLAAGADLEAQNALALLQRPVDDFPADAGAAFDGHIAFLEGVEAFAKRCAAAGSSALQ